MQPKTSAVSESPLAAAETSPTLRCGRSVITVDDDDHGILRHVPLIESSWKFAMKVGLPNAAKKKLKLWTWIPFVYRKIPIFPDSHIQFLASLVMTRLALTLFGSSWKKKLDDQTRLNRLMIIGEPC